MGGGKKEEGRGERREARGRRDEKERKIPCEALDISVSGLTLLGVICLIWKCSPPPSGSGPAWP